MLHDILLVVLGLIIYKFIFLNIIGYIAKVINEAKAYLIVLIEYAKGL